MQSDHITSLSEVVPINLSSDVLNFWVQSLYHTADSRCSRSSIDIASFSKSQNSENKEGEDYYFDIFVTINVG